MPAQCSEAWWLERFEQYDVQYVVLDPDQDNRLIQLLKVRPEWALDFGDQEGALFVRSDVFRERGAPEIRGDRIACGDGLALSSRP